MFSSASGECANERILCGGRGLLYNPMALQRGECRGVLLLCPLRQKTIHHHSLTFCRRMKMKRNIHKIIVMYGRDYTTHAHTQPEAMPLTTAADRPCGSDSLVFSHLTLFTNPGLPFSFQVLLNELHFSNHLKRKVQKKKKWSPCIMKPLLDLSIWSVGQ